MIIKPSSLCRSTNFSIETNELESSKIKTMVLIGDYCLMDQHKTSVCLMDLVEIEAYNFVMTRESQ